MLYLIIIKKHVEERNWIKLKKNLSKATQKFH